MSKAKDVETLILRFRDGLGTDNTIEKHQQIITEKGYVWWGWWAKPQETIPVATFSEMCVKISKNNNLQIYLFDSGSLNLYKAVCTKIEYEPSKEKINSPDPEATPSYYRKSMYFAWFKFTSIEQCDAADFKVKEYSYADIDEFFNDGISSFRVFDNKIIFSAQELQSQQRTIWFIRKKKGVDKKHEIMSFVPFKMSADNVDSTFKVLPNNKILWLSDLHFSRSHHAFTKTETEDNSLNAKLNEALEKENVTPSAVIVSGDITFQALPEEYGEAEDLIGKLNSAYNLVGSSYAITPGNHDLAFSDRPDKPDSPITKTYPEAKKNYESFYNKVFGCMPTDELYSIRRYLTPDLMPVEIICANSCYLQQSPGSFQGLGYVGSNQLNKIREELKLTDLASPIRILVLHHHLMPVMYKETPEYDKFYSLMLDAEAVAQFVCVNNIKVVLHGHNHKEFYAEVIRKIEDKKKKFYIIGLGSSGVKQEELSDRRQNMFALITVDKKEMKIDGIPISPTGESSKKVFSHTIPLVEE